MAEIRQVLESPAMFGLRGEVLHLDQGYVRRIFYERAKDAGLPKELLSPSSGIPGASSFCAATCPSTSSSTFWGSKPPTSPASYLHFPREEARRIVHSHLRREAMKKTSARNAFTGTINRITRGDLLVEVEILTSTGLKVVAVITSRARGQSGTARRREHHGHHQGPLGHAEHRRRAHQRPQPLSWNRAEHPHRGDRSRSQRDL